MGIAQRLDQHYSTGAGVMNVARIPAEAQRAHQRLMEAALGPVQRHQYGVSYDDAKRNAGKWEPHIAETIASALIARIGSPHWVMFHEVGLPGVGVESGYTGRLKDGPAVRVICIYDPIKDMMVLRADISISVLGSREVGA